MYVMLSKILAMWVLFQHSSVSAHPLSGPNELISESEDYERVPTPAVTGKGTEEEPFIASIDCSKVMEVCEAQCVAILCFGAPQKLTYGGPKTSGPRREASGATKFPFKPLKSGDMPPLITGGVLRGNTQVPPCHPDWVSPEDTTNACAIEGGYGTLIAPVDPDRNRGEGQRLGSQLRKAKAKKDQYFQKRYLNTGPYCSQLMADNTDTSICDAGLNDPNDPVNFMYRKTTMVSSQGLVWQKVTYPDMRWSKDFTW